MASFTIHLLIMVFYFVNKTPAFFYMFILTAFTNILIGMAVAIYAFKNPDQVRVINYDFVLWVLSGIVMFLMLSYKVLTFAKVYQRMNNPANYSLNYFGKKVYAPNVIAKSEIAAMFLTIPLFLIIGAYFIAKLYQFMRAR